MFSATRDMSPVRANLRQICYVLEDLGHGAAFLGFLLANHAEVFRLGPKSRIDGGRLLVEPSGSWGRRVCARS